MIIRNIEVRKGALDFDISEHNEISVTTVTGRSAQV